MKIGGVEVQGPAEEVLVLPRPTAQDIVIRCKAVLDMAPFEAMVPVPKAKPVLMAGGFKPNDKDPGYIQQMSDRDEMRFAYIAIKSLEPSEIEWEKVKMGEPNTWRFWDQELRDAGLSSIEINHVIVCIMSANSLDEAKLEKARESFLLGLAEPQAKSSGPDSGPKSTQPGEPAKD